MTRGKLHHIELYVHDLQRSGEFWGWLLGELGYKPFQQWRTGMSWELEGVEISLVQTPADHLEPAYNRRRTGLNHIAFCGGSRQHVDQLHAELAKRHVPLLYDHKYPHAGGVNHYAVFFEDPNRIKVEVVALE
jgi:catechol 2,3-dioxygenase-like lactoylglutathione lyase family enzyme